MNTHKVTIITVVYNGKSVIEDTIKSVLAQDYNNVEYIIIDGGSKDGTLEIIEGYSSDLKYISEPDKGVYDAMNKGIEKATGEWILFMNAGDFFFSTNTISLVMADSDHYTNYSVVYGDAEFRLKNIAYITEASAEVSSDQYMPFSHQAAFTKTDVAKATRFDLTYKIAADTAFFLQLVKNKHLMKHVPITICSYNALEGLSADNEVKRSQEIVALQAKWNNIDPNSPYFKKYIRDARIKQYIRRCIPSTLWVKLRERAILKQYKNITSI